MQKGNPSIISKPKICCIDVNDNIIENLNNLGFETFNGTLGSIMEVPNTFSGSSQLISLDYNFPDNIHEYDIFIIDFTNNKNKEFLASKTHEKKIRNRSTISLICRYPTNIFDPRPISSFILGEKLNEVKNKKIIILVFAAEDYEVEYELVKINDGYTDTFYTKTHSLYSFDNTLDIGKARYGKEVSMCNIREDIYNLLNKHLQKLTYQQTFNHSQIFDNTTNGYVPVKNIMPLMKNSNDEIVSLININDDRTTVVFPKMHDKEDLLTNLLKHILPSIYPEIFPFYSQFKWVENSEYYLPH